MGRKITNWEMLIVLSLAVVLVSQLLITPLVGVANNGDFERIMVWGGLHDPSADPSGRYFTAVTRLFALGNAQWGSYLSSEILFLKLAVLLNKLLFSREWFDIRFLGAVHSLALLCAVWLLLSGLRKQRMPLPVLTGLMLFLTLADVGFFAYFNSLFSESASLLSLLFLIGCMLHLTGREQSLRSYWVYGVRGRSGALQYMLLLGAVLSALLFVTAKVQNYLLGFLLVCLFVRLLRLHAEKRWKLAVLVSTLLLLVTTLATTNFSSYNLINIYQTVFYGVLKDSPTPQSDLRELGIRADYAVLANTNYFTPNKPIDIKSQQFAQDFNQQLNRGKILLFYAKHPLRCLEKMQVTAKNSLQLQFYLGMYERNAGHGAGTQSHAFSQWTYLLGNVLPKSLWFLAACFVTFVCAALYEWKKAISMRRKLLYEFFLLIALMALAEFVLPILGDGEADLGKHLFLFNVLFSVMLVAAVAWGIGSVVRWLQGTSTSEYAEESLDGERTRF